MLFFGGRRAQLFVHVPVGSFSPRSPSADGCCGDEEGLSAVKAVAVYTVFINERRLEA